jgi:hypothetical protein
MNNKQAAQGAGFQQVDELPTISLEALFQRLGTSEAGLSEEEAEKRLDQFGPNEVAAEKEHTWIHRLFTAARNPLVILLTVLATVSYTTGDLRAGSVMLLMVILGLSLRFVQESRARTHSYESHSFHSVAGQLATHSDYGRRYGDCHVSSLFASGGITRVCSAAAPVLATSAVDVDLLCRDNPNDQNLAHPQELGLSHEPGVDLLSSALD